ncbi:hypothetical protein Leryth_004718 [Lithospermum erythrorhizon]|nr:hypothetical protein Leryth_004718 [Lithospermum erythrorhizon]
MVNVVKGLKLIENVFTNTELSKLNDFVNELRVAGQNGELSGETFVLYNQQLKGNKRELIQFGLPIFGHVNDDETRHIEPIPALLRGVIEHLIQWKLISENRKPNGCIINFFNEGEYSQPFAKPPHLEQPISTLILSESKMAFGRTLVTDNEGNCSGPLILSLQEGSLLVMRGNSAETARHVMCASSNKRVSITFFRIQTRNRNGMSEVPHFNSAISLCQPGMPTPTTEPNVAFNDYKTMSMFPKCNILPQPMLMFAPMSPIVMTPTRVPLGGTGVFLPFKGSRKSARHFPPRAHKGRFLSLPSPPEPKPRPVDDEKVL